MFIIIDGAAMVSAGAVEAVSARFTKRTISWFERLLSSVAASAITYVTLVEGRRLRSADTLSMLMLPRTRASRSMNAFP